MRKIKVAMLAPCLSHNGVSMHINKITKYLSRRGDIDLHIITLGNKNKSIQKDNLNIHTVKKWFHHILSIPISILLLRRKILKIDPDIVHAQLTVAPYSTVAALVRNRYPVLLTVHGTATRDTEYLSGFIFILFKLVHKPNERYVVSKIPNIIIVAPQVKDIIDGMTFSKIHVIPNGIEFEDIQNIQPKSIKHPSILYVGGLRKIKGIDILLKAIPIIKEKVPTVHVYIAGSGLQENELKNIVKELNMEENVEFLGFISERDKYAYYKSTDVCVFPSRQDYGPIVLPEAMACGKPIVASNVGGIPFMVENGKTGLLFESENVEDLAEKIVTLLKDEKLRRKMGEAGKEKVKEFTWDKIAEQTVETYKEILGAKTR